MERKILVKPFMDSVKAELDVPLRCKVVPEEEQFSTETDSCNATAVFSFSYDAWFPKLFAAFASACQDPKVSRLLDGIIYRYAQACE